MDPQKITELANLLRNNGDKILNSEFTLTLSGSLLRALNDSFTLITDSTTEIGAAQAFQVAKPVNSKSPVFRDLQLIYDFVQKTTLLCIIHYPTDDYFDGVIDISKFRALRRLDVQKTNVYQIVGIQPLRSQLQQLICVKSLRSVDEVITHCGGDKSNGFVWNELKVADFSYNNLQRIDTSLEFAQFLQHLNLRHNKLRSVEAIKWLPHLKTLDLSFNCLQCIPQFHLEAYKRLQSLNMSNNCVEDLMGIAKLDALTDLDLSDNCLLDHTCLLPLSALITLKFLSLYGNALCCHPKHRLATAQFLHKNTATVKFILDFEPLSKNEKAVTGSQQLRHVGALNRYSQLSSATSINSRRSTPATQTPSSSVGSLRSFKFYESATIEPTTEPVAAAAECAKKHVPKMRTVEIEDATSVARSPDEKDEQMRLRAANAAKLARVTLTKATAPEPEAAHLEAKKQIETLREKYGANWLQSGNAEMMQSVLGIESVTNADDVDKKRNTSRQLFDDYLGELSESALSANTLNDTESAHNLSMRSSTPTNDSVLSATALEPNVSPIKSKEQSQNKTNDTLYRSVDSSNTTDITEQTLYQSVNESNATMKSIVEDTTEVIDKQAEVEVDDEAPYLKNVYASATDEEPELSEPEDDEETYIVYTTPRNDAIFLTISENFLRERDTLTQKTKTKWSLKILESCDRLKSNTLRINFDTIKMDKKERIYTVEDGLCQELEKKLRDILSKRDLTEMNQTIYRCVNCTCQFTVENKYKSRQMEIRCPDCKSTFVAEIHHIPKSLEKSATEKLSPAAIVEESPITTPLVVQRNENKSDIGAETNSIGKGPSRLTAINTTKYRSPLQALKSSANSLNESSSCSKISNSQSSFDSNQSVVGSSNAERDLEFNGESSDVDILSNPSQSSIEVLERFTGRKISEERRISQMPQLETINDYSYTQSFIEREFGDINNAVAMEDQAVAASKLPAGTETTMAQTTTMPTATTLTSATTTTATTVAGPLAHINLTESSSSGSVTDSVCTAYEQQPEKNYANDELLSKSAEQAILQNLLAAESVQTQSQLSSLHDSPKLTQTTNGANTSTPIASTVANSTSLKKEDSGISSMFGAIFQSTNILMSSSKKLIDAEASAKSGTALPQQSELSCQPYKFNYTDFNDIDHRLKLYFYQTKFEEDEQFKWLARGRIYNEQTKSLCDGIVVMSTCKCYLMEAFAPENEDVIKWLRALASVTADRLECVQLLPWKMGLAFSLRDWGHFLLLLQDILRTDSLLLYFANNSLPSQCELKYQPATELIKRLNAVVRDEQLKMCSLLSSCEVTCGQAKRNLNVCGLLTTDTHLCITSGKFDWLTTSNAEADIQICLKQLMSNLVEVEQVAANVFIINFLDETQDQSEVWQCSFETKENAESCLNAIAQSWEQLFGVSLISA